MSLTILGVVIALAVVLLVLLRPRKRGGRKQVPRSLPVRTKKYFFSQAERQFYETLKQALPPGLVAFPNVRLQDVFYISAKGEERRGVYARFQDKHIDFLVVSVRDYSPVLGIELDGSSHDRAEQQYRDAVKETVFRSADLPLMRFKNEEKLSVTALRVALGAYL